MDFKGDSVQANGNGGNGVGGTIKGQSFHDNVFGALPGGLIAIATGGTRRHHAPGLPGCELHGHVEPGGHAVVGVDCGLDRPSSAIAHWLTGRSDIAFLHDPCELRNAVQQRGDEERDEVPRRGQQREHDHWRHTDRRWPINLLSTGNVVLRTSTSTRRGRHVLVPVTPGTSRVCEEQAWETSPRLSPRHGTRVHPGETIINTCLGPTPAATSSRSSLAMPSRTTTSATTERTCCRRNAPRIRIGRRLLTRTVRATAFAGVPNYHTLQAAYNAAKASPNTKDEVIGMFSKTTENVVLDNYTAKSMTITQCTSAQITRQRSTGWDAHGQQEAADHRPRLGRRHDRLVDLETGGHELKSIRSNGASVAGVRIKTARTATTSRSTTWRAAAIGIDVLSNSNTLKSGTIGPNSGAGVHIGSGKTGNNVSGMTIQNNGNNGVLVEGNSNTIKQQQAELQLARTASR